MIECWALEGGDVALPPWEIQTRNAIRDPHPEHPEESRDPAGHIRAAQRCQFQPDPFDLFDQRAQRAAFAGLCRVRTDGLRCRRDRGGGALKRRRGRRSCVGGKYRVGIADSAPLSGEWAQRPRGKRNHRLYQSACGDQPRLVQDCLTGREPHNQRDRVDDRT